ncbi:putative glyoxalase [Octadecabacter antarcticus 307]|uniref:Putative glyoxalase n=1 Tax=Octadecabacter antarcticus 307 TaxID=391626 RepID=M9R3E8_9RHOB|nr:VOC family protein [Octadecabacter antarcticus]AGI66283.1 putative glyoxalase [Octadecabacter antarcticus 307]
MPNLKSLDHLVLTVRSIDVSVVFFGDVLGMTLDKFKVADGATRTAVKFGRQKINLHQSGAEFDPKAANPQSGSADLCFLSDTPITDWIAHFAALDVPVIDGPIPRTGATGPILSIYIRDPDGNLIEIANPI